MAFIPVPRGIGLCFHFVAAGQNWQFCITVQKDSGAIDSAALQAVAEAGEDVWTADLKPLMGTDSTLQRIVATDLSTEGGAQYIIPLVNNGTAATGVLPMNVALVVSHRTALRGRSYRGRSYWGGVPAGKQDSPTDVDTAYASDLADAFTTLNIALDTLGYKQVVASKQHNKVTTSPAAVHEVIANTVDAHFDESGRRLFGRGT